MYATLGIEQEAIDRAFAEQAELENEREALEEFQVPDLEDEELIDVDIHDDVTVITRRRWDLA